MGTCGLEPSMRDSTSSVWPGGCARPAGNGLLSVALGVMPPLSVVLIVVMTLAEGEDHGPSANSASFGRNEIPYPLRITVLSSSRYAKPRRGPNSFHFAG